MIQVIVYHEHDEMIQDHMMKMNHNTFNIKVNLSSKFIDESLAKKHI